MTICSCNSPIAMSLWFRGFSPSLSSKSTPTAFLPSSPISMSINPPYLNPSFPQRSEKPISEKKKKHRALVGFFGTGFAIALTCSCPCFASAAEFPFWDSSVLLREPGNALSLPTWAIHVSSVAEWITAMVLVWQYGDRTGYESWKGLSWGMVPLLGGAFCACTWHFFYNSESLDVLVALQGALTVIGNLTMCIAAFRIYKSSQEGSENP